MSDQDNKGEIIYISHPEVVIDPAIPVPQWPLSEVGRQRMVATVEEPWIAGATSIWCSFETKARDGAKILQQALNQPVFELEELGENDRSSTGYVAPPEFWDIVEAFFAEPETSIRGWERAIDAQNRIVEAFRKVDADAPEGDAVIVAHGGVGALSLAYFNDADISRDFDQPGPGHWFRVTRKKLSLVHGWQALPAAGANGS